MQGKIKIKESVAFIPNQRRGLKPPATKITKPARQVQLINMNFNFDSQFWMINE